MNYSIFSEKFKEGSVITIPNSATKMFEGDTPPSKEDEQLSIDWATEKIFRDTEISTVIFPYSKLSIDVEKLDHDDMDTNSKKMQVYTQYHKDLTQLLDCKVKDALFPMLFNCHSFNDTALSNELKGERPDICIGTHPLQAGSLLIKKATDAFEEQGFTVKENFPYSGCIVPLKYYQKETGLQSIMISINKKLYIKDGVVQEDKVKQLNKIFRGFIDDIII